MSFLLRWVAMAGLWILLAGKVVLPELLAAAGAGLLASAAGAYAARGRPAAEAPGRFSPVGGARLLASVVRDIGVLARVVVLEALGRRAPGGVLVTVPFAPGSGGRRALAELAGTLPAGTVVIGVDDDRGELLAHALERDADPDPLRLGARG